MSWCGDCCYFKGEDTDGYGVCYRHEIVGDVCHCSDICCREYVSEEEKRHYMSLLRKCQRCLTTVGKDDLDVEAICGAIDFVVGYLKIY